MINLSHVRSALHLGDRVRRNPVVLVGLGMSTFYISNEMSHGSLGPEDALVLGFNGILVWLGRELSIPSIKVKESKTLYIPTEEPPLHPPVRGDVETPIGD